MCIYSGYTYEHPRACKPRLDMHTCTRTNLIQPLFSGKRERTREIENEKDRKRGGFAFGGLVQTAKHETGSGGRRAKARESASARARARERERERDKRTHTNLIQPLVLVTLVDDDIVFVEGDCFCP